jgi:hypothetical protein
MKKIILAGVVVVICIMGVLFFRGRLNMGMFSRSSQQGADLIVVNDSADDISTAVKDNGKEIDTELKAGQEATGGKGFIRIYTAKKAGSYELSYPFPLTANTPAKVTLSQVVAAAQKETMGNELYIKKGMIGDINVEYEEVRELSATY